MSSTLPRAPAVRALSEGREGQLDGSSSGCLATQIQHPTESTRLPGPMGGLCSATPREGNSIHPRKGLRDVGSLELSYPAEMCAGGLGLPLSFWAPAHSPSSGETAPEPRPPGGAWSHGLEAECTACGEVSPLGEDEAAPLRRSACPDGEGLSAPPEGQSSSSAQKPDLADLRAQGCSALGEPCPDFPSC